MGMSLTVVALAPLLIGGQAKPEIAKYQKLYDGLVAPTKKKDAQAVSKFYTSRGLINLVLVTPDQKSYDAKTFAKGIASTWKSFATIDSAKYTVDKTAVRGNRTYVVVKRELKGTAIVKGKKVPVSQYLSFQDLWEKTPKGDGMRYTRSLREKLTIAGKDATPKPPNFRITPVPMDRPPVRGVPPPR